MGLAGFAGVNGSSLVAPMLGNATAITTLLHCRTSDVSVALACDSTAAAAAARLNSLWLSSPLNATPVKFGTAVPGGASMCDLQLVGGGPYAMCASFARMCEVCACTCALVRLPFGQRLAQWCAPLAATCFRRRPPDQTRISCRGRSNCVVMPPCPLVPAPAPARRTGRQRLQQPSSE